MKWPNKNEMEKYDIQVLIKCLYLSSGEKFVINLRRERPDFELKNLLTGEKVGAEITVPYLNDRSVPDRHKKPGVLNIPDDEVAINTYKERIIEKIREKIKKSENYKQYTRHILFVVLNEYESIFFDRIEWLNFFEKYKNEFINLGAFSEIIFSGQGNNFIISIKENCLVEWKELPRKFSFLETLRIGIIDRIRLWFA